MQNKTEFLPRKSWGWLWSMFLCLLSSPAIFILARGIVPRGDYVARLCIGLGSLFSISALFFAAIFPTMKYEVNNESIVLRCGPFHWTIVISDIRSVTEKDLDYVPLSEGWKLPGYTMFSMRFGDVGRVRMCATSMTKRIVLIETDQDVWGVTPNDVPGFVCAITGK